MRTQSLNLSLIPILIVSGTHSYISIPIMPKLYGIIASFWKLGIHSRHP